MIKLSDQNYVRTLENSLQVNFIVLWMNANALPLCYCLCPEEFIVASVFFTKAKRKVWGWSFPAPFFPFPLPVTRSLFPLPRSLLPVRASRSPLPVPRFSNIQFRTRQLHSRIPLVAFRLCCRTFSKLKNFLFAMIDRFGCAWWYVNACQTY